ncbi:hypothetical protein Hanom_Chr04g00360241 [Helianthus anomalus]
MSQLFISQLSRSKMGIMVRILLNLAKDPFIKVRLLVELGDAVVVSDQVANLTRHAILFLNRIDVDKYIYQVFSQHYNLYMVSFCFLFLAFNSQCSIGSDGRAYELRSKGYIRYTLYTFSCLCFF